MHLQFQIGERGKASIAYTSPTSPGSAPADTASTLLYQHSDHLTTRVTTDNAGTLSNQQAHYPYGENWYATGTADPSVTRKFTSYRKEGGSLASGQINYAVARYHGARIGRFHRPDPVRGNFRNPQRLNRYSYVIGDPIRRADRLGLSDMVDPSNAEGVWIGASGDTRRGGILDTFAAFFANNAPGSLLSRPDIMPSLNIFDAIAIYMDPDDDRGETDAWDLYGPLSNPGVVTINPFGLTNVGGMQMATSVHPTAVFFRPNPQPVINITSPGFTQSTWLQMQVTDTATGTVQTFDLRIDPRPGNPFWWPTPQSPWPNR